MLDDEPSNDLDADPLAAVVSLLRPRTVLSKVISGAGRWGVRYDAHVDPGFCLMLEGTCFLEVDGIGAIRLDEGDFLLLPATPGFTMTSHEGVKPRRARPVTTGELRHGTRDVPPTMRQLGGYFRFDRANAPLVVGLLPAMVHVRHDEPSATRLRKVVELIRDETLAQRPGRGLLLERLVEVLLIEALRHRPTNEHDEARGLLAGLADPNLAQALQRMHDDVARRWTVGELARSVGMSRASFAERFARTVGVPPMEYLAEWRIAIAKTLLRRGEHSLAEIAESIGYQSASAFSAAFSRHVACSPRAFARSTREHATA
ncbi:MAG: AraC family transcriptional regulator [Sandaracinus sp.]|nr:AraC family transcriptional regulator [Myxococcales bacterium]MCB9625407.1 AraC family transcriptional regulator [Sandaracinus sp.]MCB9631346.1 AraC family transcriptional regulator [Sandaracinus sp.]